MALGVKESVSGKLYRLTADGSETRVCGGKGSVYLSGPKVALRCYGKASIVTTRQTKQSILRQGDVVLLGLRDTFYANGTLTKYEVVDPDAAPPKMALNVVPTRVPSIRMSSAASNWRKKAKTTPPDDGRLVSSFFASRNIEKRPRNEAQETVAEVEEFTTSSTSEDAEEDDEVTPAVRRRSKRSRAIVESDDEVDASSCNDVENIQSLTVDSDLSSREEDDVFEKELQYSTSAAKDWMAAFGRSRLPADTCEKKKKGSLNGWYSRRDEGHAKQNTNKSSLKRRSLMHAEANIYDESDEEEHYSRTHDEVGQLLQECAKIARKLRQSVKTWSGNASKSASSSPSTSPADATDEEGSTHMSLASIQGGDRRVVTQADIPNICSTLELKPYQVVGVNWLLLLHENKVSGVLADEMGLGKTVQTIAFLLLLKSFETTDEQAVGPHLVVVPASVLNNWKRELAWIAPTLRVVTYHGEKEHRRAMEDTLTRDEFDIMLTTQLVPKTLSVELIQVTDEQRKAYTNILESVIKRRELVATLKAAAKEKKKMNKSREHEVRELMGSYNTPLGAEPTAMSIFTQLRKAANHPVLLRRHFVSDQVLETMSCCLHRAEAFGTQCSMTRVRQELESYCDFELHDLCVQYEAIDELRELQLPMETLLASAKFAFLQKLLPKLEKKNHRVLIFSQWTKLLDLLEVLMEYMKYRYLRLDGSTNVSERQGLIDMYNEDKQIFVFLLSTRAGGLGINLTAADTVILHDLDFNPTVDEQACDRCHRIGQTKPVTIYKLVSESTVDHDIYKLSESKTELNHKILDKLNAHGDDKTKKKKADAVTVEMMLASVISDYKSAHMSQ
ncbi:hypothetical protein PsorP6_005005 [Peronosclerospora sorghi]|uniref:Uncharacterized protein n=1 Tax=Peronosclerospora sorghi TaxID=230839 RepID=A0ACC0W271_9STRA|nr:hypothetical protein PsorP6_005005 [Peronosclerospora sorghi]